MWAVNGWTDPMIGPVYLAAVESYEAIAREAEQLPRGWSYVLLQGALSTNLEIDGIPVLMHWSRYGTGECLSCGLKYWHDFGGAIAPEQAVHDGLPWHYYHEAFTGDQLTLEL